MCACVLDVPPPRCARPTTVARAHHTGRRRLRALPSTHVRIPTYPLPQPDSSIQKKARFLHLELFSTPPAFYTFILVLCSTCTIVIYYIVQRSRVCGLRVRCLHCLFLGNYFSDNMRRYLRSITNFAFTPPPRASCPQYHPRPLATGDVDGPPLP